MKEELELLLEYDLQFFAKDGPGGEKTEEPTAKKLGDARKEGQVAKSREIANATGLIALFLILKLGMGFAVCLMGDVQCVDNILYICSQ